MVSSACCCSSLTVISPWCRDLIDMARGAQPSGPLLRRSHAYRACGENTGCVKYQPFALPTPGRGLHEPGTITSQSYVGVFGMTPSPGVRRSPAHQDPRGGAAD